MIAKPTEDQHYIFIGKVVCSFEKLIAVVRIVIYEDSEVPLYNHIVKKDISVSKLLLIFEEFLKNNTTPEFHKNVDNIINMFRLSCKFRNDIVHSQAFIGFDLENAEFVFNKLRHRSNLNHKLNIEQTSLSIKFIEEYLNNNFILYVMVLTVLSNKRNKFSNYLLGVDFAKIEKLNYFL